MRPLPGGSGRPVVVTGAGCGLGREIALGLAARRFIVFGTAGSVQEVDDLRATSGGRVSLIVSDMCRADAVSAWAAGVSEAIGASGLDLLINTARPLPEVPLELLPLEEVRRGFEANVFAGLAVINAFLPALRHAHGRIVQISTCDPAETSPGLNGLSDAAHAAMEAFTIAYRAELASFGIEVVIASVSTLGRAAPAIADDLQRLEAGITSSQRKLYGKLLRAWQAERAGTVATGDPGTIAARLIDMAVQSRMPSRVTLDPCL